METKLPLPFPESLRKYDRVIDRLITDMGIRGKDDEFRQEGKIAVYSAEDIFASEIPDYKKDVYVEMTIREHFLSLLPSND